MLYAFPYFRILPLYLTYALFFSFILIFSFFVVLFFCSIHIMPLPLRKNNVIHSFKLLSSPVSGLLSSVLDDPFSSFSSLVSDSVSSASSLVSLASDCVFTGLEALLTDGASVAQTVHHPDLYCLSPSLYLRILTQERQPHPQ